MMLGLLDLYGIIILESNIIRVNKVDRVCSTHGQDEIFVKRFSLKTWKGETTWDTRRRWDDKIERSNV
jgi:hypothetical protein